MPGRRKRRKSRKHSLVFTESPVNNQKHVPTPIFCVDNPVTAKRVPVEQDTSWVSPQFRDIHSAKKGNRFIRKYHSTIVTRSRHPSNKENTTIHHKLTNYKDKYRSLNFLVDTSLESADDISFDSRSPAANTRTSPDLHGTISTPVPIANSWSLEKLKKSRKDFNISFSESLHASSPNVNHRNNHTLNIPVETQVISTSSDVLTFNPEEAWTPTKRRSTRLQAKYLQACELFKTPPSRRDIDIKILAQDTPECEYNLSVRARQLRK